MYIPIAFIIPAPALLSLSLSLYLSHALTHAHTHAHSLFSLSPFPSITNSTFYFPVVKCVMFYVMYFFKSLCLLVNVLGVRII